MPYVPLKLKPGFYKNGTEFEASNRWRDGSLVRWLDGNLRPIEGWAVRKENFSNNPIRGMHTWQANDGTAYVAAGSATELKAMTGGGTLYDITPDDLTPGINDAAVNTGYGFGSYGTGYWGQPRPVTSDTIPQESTTWQLCNFGEELVGVHITDGRIWNWDLTTTVGAEHVTNGDFANTTDWSLTDATNWTINNNQLIYKPLEETIPQIDPPIAPPTTYNVTVVNVGGVNKYALNGAVAPALKLHRRVTYTFDLSDPSNSNHPLAFKNGSTNYTQGYTLTGTPGTAGSQVTLAVDAAAPLTGLLYWCTVHGTQMGSSVTTEDISQYIYNGDFYPVVEYDDPFNLFNFSQGFEDDDEVEYNVPDGSSAIGGLVDGQSYFVVNHYNQSSLSTSGGFALSATQGGTKLDITPPPSITVDASSATKVDVTNNKITNTNAFADNDKILYNNGNGADIGGLTSGTEYFVINRTASEFKLAATKGGAAIDLTTLGAGQAHTFRKQLGAGHTFKRKNFYYAMQTTWPANIVVTPDKQDSHDITVEVNASTISPNMKIKVQGYNSLTVHVDELLSVGVNTFRWGADDPRVFIYITPQYWDQEFYIDNISIKQVTVAEPIANAPINNKGVVVTEERFIFALGSGGNSRRVSWCDKENKNDWVASALNEAGDMELSTPGQIMCGLNTRGVTLIITDTDCFVASYQGPPYVYSFIKSGTNCGAVSRLSAVTTDLGAFWFGQENFHYFDGNSVQTISCDVHDHVFKDFNSAQQTKIWGMVNGAHNEIWWFYCSGNSTEIDRYVAFDYKDNHWLIGNLPRTSGVSRGVFTYPFMASHNTTSTINNHEVGYNYDNSQIFCETGPISIGNGDAISKVTSVISDEKTQGDVNLKFKSKFHPNDTERTFGPYNPSNPTSVRFTGRQVKMRVEGDQNTDWQVGTMRLDVKPGGKR
mgnify:CR=1 FL=1